MMKARTTSSQIFIDEMKPTKTNAPTVCGNNPKWCESCISKGKCDKRTNKPEEMPIPKFVEDKTYADKGGAE